jgi:vanillate/3-O-methylgallate O-demethylase
MSFEIGKMRTTPEGYFTSRWGLPEYTDWMDESMSWKETCYIGDWSFLWERRFKGPDALKLFSDLTVNSFAKFDIGQAKHAIFCNDNGKVIHEGILARLGEDELMVSSRCGYRRDSSLVHRRGAYGYYPACSSPKPFAM